MALDLFFCYLVTQRWKDNTKWILGLQCEGVGWIIVACNRIRDNTINTVMDHRIP